MSAGAGPAGGSVEPRPKASAPAIVEEALKSFHSCLGGDVIEWRRLNRTDKHKDIVSSFLDENDGDNFLVRTEVAHIPEMSPREVVDFLLPERKSWSSQLISERICDYTGENCVTNQVVFQGIGRFILVSLYLAEACFSDGDRGFYVVHASVPTDGLQLPKLPPHIIQKELSWSGYWIRPTSRRSSATGEEAAGSRMTWILCASHEHWMACPRALCRFSRPAFRTFIAFELRRFAGDLVAHIAASGRSDALLPLASTPTNRETPKDDGEEGEEAVEEGMDPGGWMGMLMSVQAEALLRLAEKDAEIESLKKQLEAGVMGPAAALRGVPSVPKPLGENARAGEAGKRRRSDAEGLPPPPLPGMAAAPLVPVSYMQGGVPVGQGVPIVYPFPFGVQQVPLVPGGQRGPAVVPRPIQPGALNVRHGYTMSAPMPTGSRRGRVKGTGNAKKAAAAAAGAGPAAAAAAAGSSTSPAPLAASEPLRPLALDPSPPPLTAHGPGDSGRSSSSSGSASAATAGPLHLAPGPAAPPANLAVPIPHTPLVASPLPFTPLGPDGSGGGGGSSSSSSSATAGTPIGGGFLAPSPLAVESPVPLPPPLPLPGGGAPSQPAP
eukprot:tig00021013_g17059.t1